MIPMTAMQQRAYTMMKRWCDTLLTYQVRSHTPYTNDALLCPACHVIHGRIADLCLPLTVIYVQTVDESYLQQATYAIGEDVAELCLCCGDGLTLYRRAESQGREHRELLTCAGFLRGTFLRRDRKHAGRRETVALRAL